MDWSSEIRSMNAAAMRLFASPSYFAHVPESGPIQRELRGITREDPERQTSTPHTTIQVDFLSSDFTTAPSVGDSMVYLAGVYRVQDIRQDEEGIARVVLRKKGIA